MPDQPEARKELLPCPNPFKGRLAVFGGSDCIIWLGAKTKRGYGHLSFAGNPVLAHRLMWILEFGSIRKGLEVCHTCDNPPCVNPKHLWLGTHSENMKDAFRKGRVDVMTPGIKGGETTKRLLKGKKKRAQKKSAIKSSKREGGRKWS